MFGHVYDEMILRRGCLQMVCGIRIFASLQFDSANRDWICKFAITCFRTHSNCGIFARNMHFREKPP